MSLWFVNIDGREAKLDVWHEFDLRNENEQLVYSKSSISP